MVPSHLLTDYGICCVLGLQIVEIAQNWLILQHRTNLNMFYHFQFYHYRPYSKSTRPNILIVVLAWLMVMMDIWEYRSTSFFVIPQQWNCHCNTRAHLDRCPDFYNSLKRIPLAGEQRHLGSLSSIALLEKYLKNLKSIETWQRRPPAAERRVPVYGSSGDQHVLLAWIDRTVHKKTLILAFVSLGHCHLGLFCLLILASMLTCHDVV